MQIIVDQENGRIDSFLAKKTDYSRSKITALLHDEKILVNNKSVKASYLVKDQDVIDVPDIYERDETLSSEEMPLDIVYEDEYLAIINKKSGIVVHPSVGNLSHTLANGLLYHFKKVSQKESARPGIVHRLDKDTSGLMVVAKDDKVHEMLSLMIKNKEVERKYLALVWGVMKHDHGTIDAPIGRDINNRQKYTVTNINSKKAITHFNVCERYKNATLVELILDTGRTHQIRVHMNYISHPIVNDLVYGRRKVFDEEFGQLLHSKSIKFVHPITKQVLYYECEVPDEFKKIVEIFKNE